MVMQRRMARLALVWVFGVAAVVAMAPPARVAASSLPKIGHVWIIVVENTTSAFTGNTYLATTVRSQGAYIPGYFGIAHESAPNYIAMISGQGASPDTQADCMQYQDVNPGGGLGNSGQYYPVTSGCVYPSSVKTVADQLNAAGRTWKGYMEDMGQDPNRDGSFTCNPTNAANAGTKDGTQGAAQPGSTNGNRGDQYAVRHDPFMYFHSIIDPQSSCLSHVVELQDGKNGLTADLGSVATTPNYSFITPNLCDDGHDPSGTQTTCAAPDIAGSSIGHLTGVNDFLQVYVPQIVNSPAFRQDGMLVITVDESDGSPGSQDASSCCQESTVATQNAGGDSNSPQPGINGSGGGQVGTVVLSPFIHPGTTSNQEYNHFNLLRTVEDIFQTTGGKDGHHLGWAGTYPNVGYAPCQQAKSTDPCQTDFGADVFSDPTGQSHPDVGGGQSGTVGSTGSGGPTGPSNLHAPPPVGASPASDGLGVISVNPYNPAHSAGGSTPTPGTGAPASTPPATAPLLTSLTGPHLDSPSGFPFGLFLVLALAPMLGIAGVILYSRRQGT
jgi:phosphatidylinositol-3-phosphatase